MKNLSPDICVKLKMARREAGLSQSEVAAEVGCKQNALSMFEQGQPTKLNDEVVEKLAKKFNIDLSTPSENAAASVAVSSAALAAPQVSNSRKGAFVRIRDVLRITASSSTVVGFTCRSVRRRIPWGVSSARYAAKYWKRSVLIAAHGCTRERSVRFAVHLTLWYNSRYPKILY